MESITSHSQQNILDIFQSSFSALSLDELNKKAKMLERNEQKYILSLQNISDMLPALSAEFEILEINKKRNFQYETIYFDDDKSICYRQHHQKKRQRFKARTRKYVEAGLYFFEFKLKDTRGKTNKKRYACSEEEHGIITEKSKKLMRKNFKNLYKKDFSYNLFPSNAMSYQRITLVAKKGNERLTIDYNLKFFYPGKKERKKSPNDFIIIETKSVTGNGIADKILKLQRHRSVSCSKFCLSKILLNQVDKYNSFLPLLKKHFSEIVSL